MPGTRSRASRGSRGKYFFLQRGGVINIHVAGRFKATNPVRPLVNYSVTVSNFACRTVAAELACVFPNHFLEVSIHISAVCCKASLELRIVEIVSGQDRGTSAG